MDQLDLGELKKLRLNLRKLSAQSMSGRFRSVFRGQGQEFEKVREYAVGDDVRHLDWNVTARTGEPHLKVFREERNLSLHLLVDVSKSQLFGTDGNLKITSAIQTAAMLAWLATQNQDQVSLTVYSDHVEQTVPLGKGKSHIAKIIQTLSKPHSLGDNTCLTEAIDHLLKISKKRSLVFIISDFEDQGFEQKLKKLNRYHEVTCCHIYDPSEAGLLQNGFIRLQDAESNQPSFWLGNKKQKVMENIFTEHLENTKNLLQKTGCNYFRLSTKQSTSKVLAHFIQKTGRRR